MDGCGHVEGRISGSCTWAHFQDIWGFRGNCPTRCCMNGTPHPLALLVKCTRVMYLNMQNVLLTEYANRQGRGCIATNPEHAYMHTPRITSEHEGSSTEKAEFWVSTSRGTNIILLSKYSPGKGVGDSI